LEDEISGEGQRLISALLAELDDEQDPQGLSQPQPV